MDHSPGFLAHVQSRTASVKEASVEETQRALEQDSSAKLVDVREDREWMASHAAGAVHIARGVLERDIERLVPDKSTTLYLYCGGGFRSALAVDSLQQMGYSNVTSIAGGWRAWEAAGAPVDKPDTPSPVTGIGGIFFRSPDPAKLKAWYGEHLGIKSESWGAQFPFREHNSPTTEGFVAWSVSPNDTTYFGESGQQFMINYRVRGLDALLEDLRAKGVHVDDRRDEESFGKFAWITDGDGNRVELWEAAEQSE